MAGGAAGQQSVGSQGVRQTPPVQPSMNNLPPAMGGMGGVGQNQLGAANNAAINRIAPITGAGTSNPYGIGPTGVQTPAVQQPRIGIPTPVGVQPPATQTQSLPSTLGNIGGALGGVFGGSMGGGMGSTLPPPPSQYGNYGFSQELQSFLDGQRMGAATDAGVAYNYDPNSRTFSGGTMGGTYSNIPLDVMQNYVANQNRTQQQMRDLMAPYAPQVIQTPNGPMARTIDPSTIPPEVQQQIMQLQQQQNLLQPYFQSRFQPPSTGGIFGGAMNPENTTFTKNYGTSLGGALSGISGGPMYGPLGGGIGLGGAGQVQQPATGLGDTSRLQRPEFYTNYLRELENSGQRNNLPITPGPIRSTPMPAQREVPEYARRYYQEAINKARVGPQVQPIRRPLPMTGLGGLAGLAGMFRGRQ